MGTSICSLSPKLQIMCRSLKLAAQLHDMFIVCWSSLSRNWHPWLKEKLMVPVFVVDVAVLWWPVMAILSSVLLSTLTFLSSLLRLESIMWSFRLVFQSFPLKDSSQTLWLLFVLAIDVLNSAVTSPKSFFTNSLH